MSAQHARSLYRFRWLAASLILAASVVALAQPRALQAAADGEPWLPPITVDPGGGSVGSDNSVAIVDGHPAIAYYDATNNATKYVRATDPDGAAWGSPVVLDSAGGSTRPESLQVVNGRPAVIYVTANALKYVRALDAAGLAWGDPVTITALADEPDVSLQVVNGSPAVAYVAANKPVYARATDADGSGWGAPVAVDSVDALSVWGISLRVVQGAPALAYVSFGADHHDVRYVRAADANGGTWAAPLAVSEEGASPSSSSMALVNGRPAISYTARRLLRFVRASDARGAAWGAPVTVLEGDPLDSLSQTNRLAVVDGRPAVGYQTIRLMAPKQIYSDLRYVRAADADGARWASPVLVDASWAGDYSMAAVSGRPALAFMRLGPFSDLMFVRAADGSGENWPPATLVDAGSGEAGVYSSLAAVDGKAAIVYEEPYAVGFNTGLKYVRSLDEPGTAWAPPVLVDDVGNPSSNAELVVLNGKPAICYASGGAPTSLKYAAAADNRGDSWGAPVSVGDVAQDCSLTTIGSAPAIAYIADGLKLVQALDAGGAAWGEPRMIDPQANGMLSLAWVNGKLAAAYTRSQFVDGTPPAMLYEMRYVQAASADGATWSTPVVLDSIQASLPMTSEIGGPAMVLVNGFPAVGYYRNGPGGGGEVRYVQATDANGAGWGSVSSVATTTGAVWSADLVVTGGAPAAAFAADRILYYIEVSEGDGGSWGPVQILDVQARRGRELSMNIVAGLPAISYPGSLRYVTQLTGFDSSVFYLPLCRK